MNLDCVLESKGLIIKNLNNKAKTKDEWHTGPASAYNFYSISYLDYLKENHIYYTRWSYKFTTTNQTPAWVGFYFQGGTGGRGGGGGGALTVNTEQTFSAITAPAIRCTFSRSGGDFYNGPAENIKGVTASIRNLMIYDVTYLYQILTLRGIIAPDEKNYTTLKTWCDSNLEWKVAGEAYDVSNVITNDTTSINKVAFKKGIAFCDEIIEPDYMRSLAPTQNQKLHAWFDEGSALATYNNSASGKVTLERVSAKEQRSPFWYKHPYILKIKTDGTPTAPGAGGFISVHNASASKVFIEKFVAKIPIGFTVIPAYNSQGTSATVTMISNNKGTGNWEEYSILYKCGASGPFSSGGHVYISGKGTGKNILKYEIDSDGWTISGTNVSSKIIDNRAHWEGLATNPTSGTISLKTKSSITLEAKEYVLSFDVRTNKFTTLATPRLVGTSTLNFPGITFTANEIWQRVSAKIKVSTAGDYNLELYNNATLGVEDNYLEIKNIMLSTIENTEYTAYDKNDRVTWYVAYVCTSDITGKENLANYSVIPKKTSIKSGYLTANEFNEADILPEGKLSNIMPAYFRYDETDFAGDSTRSIVQKIGSGGYNSLKFPFNIKVDPSLRYKFSMWVKCKGDMSSFLVNIRPVAEGKELNHYMYAYFAGTKTILTADLNPGDTQMTVENNANWASSSLGYIGFRKSRWFSSYNDLGETSDSDIVSGISGSNVITLKKAYTGTKMPKNTCIVHSFAGSNWIYPIGKPSLPTNNEWKYVEGYFGDSGVISDGTSSGPYPTLVADVTEVAVSLNLYSNNGSVPIKYSDIRITPYSYKGNEGRREKKITLDKYN